MCDIAGGLLRRTQGVAREIAAGLCWCRGRRREGSERRIVAGGLTAVRGDGVGGAALLLFEQGLHGVEVEGGDGIAQLVEQFEDGERLLGRPIGGNDDVGCPAGRRRRVGDCGSWLALSALTCALFIALTCFFDTVGLAIDGDDLGIVGQAVDQGDDAGGIGEHVFPFGEGAVAGDQGAPLAVLS